MFECALCTKAALVGSRTMLLVLSSRSNRNIFFNFLRTLVPLSTLISTTGTNLRDISADFIVPVANSVLKKGYLSADFIVPIANSMRVSNQC